MLFDLLNMKILGLRRISGFCRLPSPEGEEDDGDLALVNDSAVFPHVQVSTLRPVSHGNGLMAEVTDSVG